MRDESSTAGPHRQELADQRHRLVAVGHAVLGGRRQRRCCSRWAASRPPTSRASSTGGFGEAGPNEPWYDPTAVQPARQRRGATRAATRSADRRNWNLDFSLFRAIPVRQLPHGAPRRVDQRAQPHAVGQPGHRHDRPELHAHPYASPATRGGAARPALRVLGEVGPSVTDASVRVPTFAPGQPRGCRGFFVGSGLAPPAAVPGLTAAGRACYKQRMPVRLTAAAVCVCLALVASALDAHARRTPRHQVWHALTLQCASVCPPVDIERYPDGRARARSPRLREPRSPRRTMATPSGSSRWCCTRGSNTTRRAGLRRRPAVAPARCRRGGRSRALLATRMGSARRGSAPVLGRRLALARHSAARPAPCRRRCSRPDVWTRRATLYEPPLDHARAEPAARYGLGRVAVAGWRHRQPRARQFERAVALVRRRSAPRTTPSRRFNGAPAT